MRRQTYQPCELTACARNAGVPVCALCRWVDHLETVPAYAQEVQQKPSEESCERLWQLNFVLDACQVVVALGGGGHFFLKHVINTWFGCQLTSRDALA